MASLQVACFNIILTRQPGWLRIDIKHTSALHGLLCCWPHVSVPPTVQVVWTTYLSYVAMGILSLHITSCNFFSVSRNLFFIPETAQTLVINQSNALGASFCIGLTTPLPSIISDSSYLGQNQELVDFFFFLRISLYTKLGRGCPYWRQISLCRRKRKM